MTATTRRRLRASLCLPLSLPLCLGLLLGLPACTSNPTPADADITVTRLVTVPAGAKVYFPRLGRGGLVTPMDISRDIRTTDRIRIVKDGFETWEGQLQQLWQETDSCYKLRLIKVD